jgi:quercetin dioxygenase-like cupin family protein
MLFRLVGVCLIFLTYPAFPVFSQNAGNVPKATIVSLDNAVTRSVPSGKASIKILAEGQKAFVGQLSLAAGAKVPLHRDPTEEYLYIVSGQGLISIDGQTTKVVSGMTVYMPANALVTFQNGDKPLVALQVFAGPASAKKYEKWALLSPKKP